MKEFSVSFIIRFLKLVKKILEFFFDYLKPFIRKKKYRNYVLYYSRGTSLIDHIARTKIYEPELSSFIVRTLKLNSEKPVFVDVGANIGLITLNVLADLPQTIIYAFEPGPHQYALLKKTIEANNLKDRVFLYKKALSNKPGRSRFAVHETKHSSGDGFLFTGRAKSAQYISVDCQTLDNWWKINNKKNIKLIKIDTEGSELMVLDGAKKVIENCQPFIVLEIWPKNLEVYPYGVEDILFWFDKQNYTVYTLNGNVVNSSNIEKYLGVFDSFVAFPISKKYVKKENIPLRSGNNSYFIQNMFGT
jgi:FkbM family methyltransferase